MAKNQNSYVEINKYIDTKPMFGNWEVDVIVVAISFLAIGVIVANDFLTISIFIALGLIAGTYYNKAKQSRVKGFFFHLLYMLGLRQPKTLPPSYMRYFLGA